MGCDATSFTGLEKHADNIKDYGKSMYVMCLIKKADPQHFYQLWNELEDVTFLGESNDMYPNNISKSYDVLWKYKKPSNIKRLPRNRIDMSFHQRGAGNHIYPTSAGNNYVLHREAIFIKMW